MLVKKKKVHIKSWKAIKYKLKVIHTPSPSSGSALIAQSLLRILSSLCPFSSLSLKINVKKKKKLKKKEKKRMVKNQPLTILYHRKP